MSQPGNYRYQSYDQTGSLKGGMPPMVNGQPSAIQHTQNGIQLPSFNSAGTPSSHSSRDLSRETSRDPSPTQYLNNQYRPQVSRPLLPPINGQQPSPPHVPMSQQSRSLHSSQSSTPVNPQNTSNQFVSAQTSNSAVFSSQTKPLTCSSSAQSSSTDSQIGVTSQTQKTVTPTKFDIPSFDQSGPLKSDSGAGGDSRVRTNLVSQSGQSIVGQNFPPIGQSTIQSQSFNNQANWSKEQGTVMPNTTNKPLNPTGPDHVWRNQNIEPNSNNSQMTTQPYSAQSTMQTPATIAPTVWNKEVNVSSAPNFANQAAPTLVNPSKTWRNPVADANTNNNQTTTQPYAGMLHQNVVASQPRIQPPTAQNTVFIQPPTGSTTGQSAPSYFQQSLGNKPNSTNPIVNMRAPQAIGPQALPTTSGINTSMQNVFGTSQPNQRFGPTNQASNQNLLGPKIPPYPSIPNPQVHYPTADHQANTPAATGTNQFSQSAYDSQQNVASQRKYPQIGYSAQLPTGSAGIGSPHHGGSNIPGVMSSSTGQIPLRPPPTSVPAPSLSAQQREPPLNYRDPYIGQMSNVPLDNMTKRYPTTNPEQMNRLNAQMANVNVTQSGFNELWGQQSVDLLLCRDILPGDRVEPPKIKLHQEFLDSVNCSPDIFRCTLTRIPESNSLLQKCRLPLGVLIHPFKDLNHLPVIQCSTIVRCRACRTYINPFVYFVDSKRWKCNLCYRVNELPEEFQFDPVTKSYGDPSRRPEVKTSTIEFIAPSEYMLRPPQPAVYLFILDVSRLAVDSGYLSVVCETIADELTKLPGDGRTQIGFIAIDSAIHFFSIPENVSQPHELIMLDVDDVFLPCPDNLIVNLKEREELIRDLLEQLPVKFNGTHDTNSALGAGLQAAFKLMSPTGGRITVFQTCLPNLGPGALQPREDPNTRTSKDVPHLNPATDFYKRLALDCSGQQIAVDLFLLNSQYSDLATLSGMCKFSGGCIYHIPLFRRNKPQHSETLEKMLRRYLTRKIGFEAVMRIRCTRGLSIHTFHGNFFVRSTDLLSLPNVNPDAGFGMQVSIEENLSDVQTICFQAALLYTSSKGERRIRVHTLCLPVSSNMTDILYSADQQAIVGLLSKMAVDRSQQSSLSDARDALINVAIDVLSSYKLSQSTSVGGLMAPGNLKLLPLYLIALIKSMSFRSGTSTRLDDRVYSMCQMKTLPLLQLMQIVYPDLYPVHALDDRYSKDIDGKVCPQSPRIHLSAEKLDFRGVFLMDAGDRIYIYVGKSVDPMFCCNVLGVTAFTSIPEECYDLPELDTVESDRLRNFVFSLQEEKPYHAPMQIIRDDSHFRSLFTDRLIEDRFESALSYYEFLQHLKTQVK